MGHVMALMYIAVPEGAEFETMDALANGERGLDVAVFRDCGIADRVARAAAKKWKRAYVVAKVVQVSYHPARGTTVAPE